MKNKKKINLEKFVKDMEKMLRANKLEPGEAIFICARNNAHSQVLNSSNLNMNQQFEYNYQITKAISTVTQEQKDKYAVRHLSDDDIAIAKAIKEGIAEIRK